MATGWAETSEAFYRYLITRGRTVDTATTYAAHLRPFWQWCNGEPALASTETVERYLAHELAEHARSTAHVRLSSVKAFFAWLKDAGIRREDPSTGLTVKKEKHLSRPPVNDGDELRLLTACRDDEERLLFVLGFRLGLRIGEITSLRVEDIFPERREMIVRGKGQKERPMPMDVVILRSLSLVVGDRERGLVFRGLDRRQARRIMQRVAKHAGVKNFYPHKMRITFAVSFLDRKHDIDSLQELMGHTTADVTSKYASFNRRERAMQQLRDLQDEQTKADYPVLKPDKAANP